MKKLLIFIAAAAIQCIAMAQSTVVNVVWPFAPGGTQAVMLRHVIDAANQNQNKYNFVFVSKPGAGGSIAANTVASSNSLTVLASTSSFYSRPLMYKESHNIEQFKMVGVICERGPIALFSKKYKTFSEARSNSVSVGVIPGSVTQLMTQLLQKNNPELKFVEVPYKDTPSATSDMLGGHIDASSDLLSTGNLARLTADARVIGITGTRSIDGLPNFSSMGVKGLENLTNSYYLWVLKTVDRSTQQELNQIFNASLNQRVKDSCTDERGVVESADLDKLETIDRNNKSNWVQLTRFIEKQ